MIFSAYVYMLMAISNNLYGSNSTCFKITILINTETMFCISTVLLFIYAIAPAIPQLVHLPGPLEKGLYPYWNSWPHRPDSRASGA